MSSTLENSSGIFLLKSKFFLYRAVSYFSFLLIPVWIQKSLNLNQALLCLMMTLYILFMVGQWFLLGKEIDYRLKIYFRVNSSIDRVVYRLMLGMVFISLYFNLLGFLPGKWVNNLFWTTWVILGLFYSWPTRGKIIQESVSSNFNEFRYLDSFERTLVGLIILLFIFSVPELPNLVDYEALKLFFDPLEKISGQFWVFLNVNYTPFLKYPELFKLALCMHFYILGIGVFLLIFYALLRFFVSRRLSLLGVFALLSSWSFSKILVNNFGASILTTYSVLWVWTLLWITKSSTYRAGLFLGLMGYWGAILNQSFSFLLIVQIALLYFLFLEDKTPWFKRQLLKYSSLGAVLTLVTLWTNFDSLEFMSTTGRHLWMSVISVIQRKAFYSLSFFGFVILFLKMLPVEIKIINDVKIDRKRLIQLFVSFSIFLGISFIFDDYLLKSFSIMWPIVLISLIPLEVLFQSISRLRSSRNMIYLIYILICLLDSHFEGRIKIFLRLIQG